MTFWERNLTTVEVLVFLLLITLRVFWKRGSRSLEKMIGNSSRGSGSRQQETKPFLLSANSDSSNSVSTRKTSDAAPEMFGRVERGSPVSIMSGDV